jgi:PAS domain S-box-containing protein
VPNQLQRQRSRHRAPVEATLDQGICVVDADQRVVMCDQRFLELLDYPPALGRAGRPATGFERYDVRRGRDGRHLGSHPVSNGRRPAGPAPAAVRRIEAGGRAVDLHTWRLPDGGFVQVCTDRPADAAGPQASSADHPSDPGLSSALGEAAPEAFVWDRRQRHLDGAEAGADWLWETDPQLRFTYCTDQFTALTGIPAEQVIGRTRTELAADLGLEGAELRRHRADLEARRPFRDVCYRLPDPATGAMRHVRVSGKPVFDRAGRFLGYRGTGADVTAEVEATRSAARAEVRLRDAIESINDGFALFDDDDRLVICNRRFCEIDGLSDELMAPGTSWEAILRAGIERGHYADVGGAAEAYLAERLAHHRRADGSVLEHRLCDGRWIRIGEYRTSDGGTVGTRTDITELKRRESARIELSDQLRTQYLRFNAALNNMIQGLCMFDADQRLIVCNERYLQMYGFSPEVVKPGIGLREIMEYSVSLGNYRIEDAERAITERPTTADKREQAVLHQRLDDGRVIAVMHQPMAHGGSVATYEDVTQAVRAEEALRGYARKLERSNRELQDFASIASHDLQEPLRKIEAFGDRLKAKCGDDLSEAGRVYIDRMQDAARRMRSLINDLLTYSRVTTKARPFVPVDLGRIAHEVMSDLQVTIEHAGARIELGDLPVIEADPTQMRQLLQNLLSNALKFRRPGVPPVVRISGRLHGPEGPDPVGIDAASGLCQVTVADNGIGFKPDYAIRIFGIFQRLHGRGDYPGTGIGLATCRKILERHGGTIAASGRPGAGATFVFTLPTRQRSEPGF